MIDLKLNRLLLTLVIKYFISNDEQLKICNETGGRFPPMPFINNYSIECVGQAGRMDGLSAKLRHQTKPGPGLHLSEPRDIGQTFNKDFI